jgi:hypothetical protein
MHYRANGKPFLWMASSNDAFGKCARRTRKYNPVWLTNCMTHYGDREPTFTRVPRSGFRRLPEQVAEFFKPLFGVRTLAA